MPRETRISRIDRGAWLAFAFMEQIVASGAPHRQATYGASGGLIQPAGGGLADWLRTATPLGAPALQCHLPGSGYRGEVVLPLAARDLPGTFQREEVEQRPDGSEVWSAPINDVSLGRDWIASRLAQILPPSRGRETDAYVLARADLAGILGPGPRRPNGLPAYWPSEPGLNDGLIRALGPTVRGSRRLKLRASPIGLVRVLRDGSGDGHRLHSPARKILAAVAIDLAGCDIHTVSSGLLGHSADFHSAYANPKKGAAAEAADPRRAREHRREGRRYLAQLGAWPWHHAPNDGKLDAGWWESERYLAPLRSWLERAAAETRAESERSEAALAAIRAPGRERPTAGMES